MPLLVIDGQRSSQAPSPKARVTGFEYILPAVVLSLATRVQCGLTLVTTLRRPFLEMPAIRDDLRQLRGALVKRCLVEPFPRTGMASR